MRIISIVFFLGLLSSCKVHQVGGEKQTVLEQVSIPESGLVHTVYFWFVDTATDAQKSSFEQGLKELSKVPSIAKFYWGPPAATVKREVVDNSYDYAINVFFDSVANQEAYQVDALHLKFVEEYGPLFEKVIVYDNQY